MVRTVGSRGATYATRVVVGRDGFDHVRDAWVWLAAHGAAVWFNQEVDWAEATAEQFPQLRWLYVEQAGEPVAVVPHILAERRLGTCRVRVALKPDWWCDAIVRRDVAPFAIRSALQKSTGAAALIFDRVRAQSGFHHLSGLAVDEMPSEPQFGGYSVFRTVERPEDALARVPKKMRSNLQNARNRLDAAGGG